MEQTLVEKELGTTIKKFNFHRILVKAIVVPEKTAGGFYLPETYNDMRAKAYNIGRVLKIGDACFKPEEKFPYGPLCEEGEWIYYSDYQRSTAYINNFLCYHINDDAVLQVIDDIGAAVPFLKGLHEFSEDRNGTS
jgi:co-chaperonin GroES (HSP10)